MAHLLKDIIVKPLITEKATITSEKVNRYGFIVNLKANKNQIRKAVEYFYDVRVLDVKTNIAPGKTRRFGRMVKKTKKIKKAFVRLASGQKIEFFKGV